MPNADRTRRELRNRARLALWLALPFVALTLLVSPRGDFPLNDDWVYAKMVQALADHGHFGLSPLSNAYALTQTLYAAPLVKLFGFSFTLLRLTTIFMGWVTVCFTAFTARELGLSNRAAVLAAMTVFVNPLFVNLSYTFMTDVPFCAFAMISVYYYVKALHRPTTANVLLGTIFSIAAFYNRQFGALIPLAFLLASILQHRTLDRRKMLKACLLIAAPWAIAAYLAPSSSGHGLEFVARPFMLTRYEMAGGYLLRVLFGFALCGLCMLPIVAIRKPRILHYENHPRRTAALLTFAVAAYGYLSYWMYGFWLFSWGGTSNIIRFTCPGFGFGPVAFSFMRSGSTEDWIPIDLGIHIPFLFRTIATFTLFFVGLLALVRVAYLFRPASMFRIPARSSQRFFLIFAATGLLFAPQIAMSGAYFDRYVLPAAPMLVLLVAGTIPPHIETKGMTRAVFLIAALGALSVMGEQDYMAWNTARWTAITELKTTYGASNNEISAGYEFNGMYTSDEYIDRLEVNPDAFRGKPWWALAEKYLVSPQITGVQNAYAHKVLKEIPYFSWLGFQMRDIYILQKESQP